MPSEAVDGTQLTIRGVGGDAGVLSILGFSWALKGGVSVFGVLGWCFGIFFWLLHSLPFFFFWGGGWGAGGISRLSVRQV